MRRARMAAVLLVAAMAACGPETRRPEIGAAAPDYAAPSLAGDTLALEELRGSPVLVNIWATWCVPCREEMPELQALHEELAPRGLRVVGVSIDQKQATGEVRRFLDEHGVDFTILHDPQSRVARVFRTVGVPETLLIGADGELRARWIGQVTARTLRPELESALSAAR